MKKINFIYWWCLILFFLSPKLASSQTWHDLYSTGEKYSKMGDYKFALKRFHSALNFAEKEYGKDSTLAYTNTLLQISDAFKTINLDSCKFYAEFGKTNYLSYFQTKDTTKNGTYIRLNSNILDVEELEKKIDKDERVYIENIFLAKLIYGDTSQQAYASLFELFYFYFGKGKDSIAATMISDLLPFSKSQLGEKSKVYIFIVRDAGIVYMGLDNHSMSTIMLKDLIKLNDKYLRDPETSYTAWNLLGTIYSKQKEYKNSKLSYIKALDIIESLKNDSLNLIHGTIEGNLGYVLLNEKLYKEALKHYEIAMKLYKTFNYKNVNYEPFLNNIYFLYSQRDDSLGKEKVLIEFELLEQNNKPNGGLGIRFEIVNDSINVTEVFNDSPAMIEGILKNDKIICANDVDLFKKGITNNVVLENLRGDEGSSVKLKIWRKNEFKVIYVIRRKIEMK